jgi:DNA repair protein RecO (recombination protein O)
MPNIKKCTRCDESENIAYFSIADNGFKCTSCGKADKSAINISPTTVDAIRYIVTAPAKKVFSFDLPEEAIKEISLVSKVYLKDKID